MDTAVYSLASLHVFSEADPMKRLPLDDSFKVNRNPVALRDIVLDKLRSAIMNFQLLSGGSPGRTRSVREALRHLDPASRFPTLKPPAPIE